VLAKETPDMIMVMKRTSPIIFFIFLPSPPFRP
jgi:hypothetical protein